MPKGISIHIGLNTVDPEHYQGWSGPLQACEHDAQDLQQVAESQGFQSRLLLTLEATRERVSAEIRQAAEGLDEDGILMLTYSGHGGQVPDYNLDEEMDNEDETWCLFDGQFLDDELFTLWAEFKPGARILVLSDSCHSGSVVKQYYSSFQSIGLVAPQLEPSATAPQFRMMPDEAAVRTYRENRAFYDSLQTSLDPDIASRVQASVLLISGCQDNQCSLDGTFNGLFTGTLLQVWRDGSYSRSYRDFHRDIVRRMPPTQTPNYFTTGMLSSSFEAQQPFTI